jgi:hypothetical protein
MYAVEPRFIFAALAFPGLFVNLITGQNGCLTLACLVAGVLNVDKRSLVSGVAFGLMAYKPHFALLIPLFLLLRRSWKVAGAAAAMVLMLVAGSVAAFGAHIWITFFLALNQQRKLVLEAGGWLGLQSTFNTIRLLGLGRTADYAVHVTAAAIAVLLACWVWLKTDRLELHGAALLITALIATPYVFQYDLVLLAPALAWLSYWRGISAWENAVLLTAWLYPDVALLAIRHHAPVAPALLFAMLFVTVLRCAWSARDVTA